MARHGENIYKRRDGRYEGRYVTGKTAEGKTRFGYVYARRYSEVKRLLLMKKAQCANRRAASSVPGVCDWLSAWLENDIAGHVKCSTYHTYSKQLRAHIQPYWDGRTLTDVTVPSIQGWIAYLREKGLAGNTVKCVYRLFAAGMRAAMEEGLLPWDPCKRLRLPSDVHEEQRVLTRQEQSLLRTCCMSDDGLPALVSLYTGLRLGEVCALMWSDIDLEKRTLTVRRTVQRISRPDQDTPKTQLLIGTPKTRQSCRTLPLPDFLAQRLRALGEGTHDAYLFGRGERTADPRTIQRRFQRFAARCGVTGVHFHTLRHSFATRLLELGVDIKTVSALMGHSTAQVTINFYAHSLPSQQRSAISLLAGEDAF